LLSHCSSSCRRHHHKVHRCVACSPFAALPSSVPQWGSMWRPSATTSWPC
jgi:hypothetical protein